MIARFQETYCSQCGGSFGPGNSGFSHCQDHPPYASANAYVDQVECPSCRACRDNCRLCGGRGVVSEQQSRDWPEAG